MDKKTWGNVFLFFSAVFLCVLAYMFTHLIELKIYDPITSRRVLVEFVSFIVFLLLGIVMKVAAGMDKRRHR